LELQRLLNQAGASPRLVVDGLFGPKTEEAVRSITGRDGETVARVDASAWSRIAIESAKEAPRVDAPSAPKYGEPAPEGSVPARDLVRADEARRSQRRTSGPPEGYRAMTGRIPAGVVAKAKSLLHHDYGTEIPFELEGRRYVARLERHYHPPGYVGGPNGWHKGVTVYEAK
jgi:peptidoglycan hydrolase-like protein with peptidoglycan-binding domain